ncbi:unnamed protein product, partial [Urochloa humidicola]
APDRPPYPFLFPFLKRAAPVPGSPAAAPSSSASALWLGAAVPAAADPELLHRRGSSVREVEVLVRRRQPDGLGAAAAGRER